ncbi:MAG: polyprenyl synthetase family protein [bacterium]
MFQIKKKYSHDLKSINEIIHKTLYKKIKHSQKNYIDHILTDTGKQLRPLISLVTYRNYSKSEHPPKKLYILSSAIELVHLASLIHDDVIDNANTRRNNETLNTKWNNSNAVALGTFVYSNALNLIHQANDNTALGYFTKVVQNMCHGELYQLEDRKKDKISLLRYYKILYYKTGALFSAATWLGSYIADQSTNEQNLLKKIGKRIGFLYQLCDDILDISDTDKKLKKETFQDLINGQLTYPFILYFKEKNTYNKKELSNLKHKEIQAEFNKHQIIEKCQKHLQIHLNETHSLIEKLSSKKLIKNLKKSLDYISKRA